MRIDESMSKTCFSCFPMLTCRDKPGLLMCSIYHPETYAGAVACIGDCHCE